MPAIDLEDAQERINALPRQQVPQCVIFAKYAFIAGSFGDTLSKSGALAFMEDKMRDFLTVQAPRFAAPVQGKSFKRSHTRTSGVPQRCFVSLR